MVKLCSVIVRVESVDLQPERIGLCLRGLDIQGEAGCK